LNKRTIALLVEAIPVVSAVLSIALIASSVDSDLVRRVILVSTPLAFLGFVFFFVGRKLAKEDRAVRLVGILDWLATLSIIALYTLAVFSFGL
jgi:hypothetical protein